jgi:hypothetical protein
MCFTNRSNLKRLGSRLKIEDHDVRAPIFGMGREVASSCCIWIFFKTTTNSNDLPRTVVLAPLLD